MLVLASAFASCASTMDVLSFPLPLLSVCIPSPSISLFFLATAASPYALPMDYVCFSIISAIGVTNAASAQGMQWPRGLAPNAVSRY